MSVSFGKAATRCASTADTSHGAGWGLRAPAQRAPRSTVFLKNVLKTDQWKIGLKRSYPSRKGSCCPLFRVTCRGRTTHSAWGGAPLSQHAPGWLLPPSPQDGSLFRASQQLWEVGGWVRHPAFLVSRLSPGRGETSLSHRQTGSLTQGVRALDLGRGAGPASSPAPPPRDHRESAGQSELSAWCRSPSFQPA